MKKSVRRMFVCGAVCMLAGLLFSCKETEKRAADISKKHALTLTLALRGGTYAEVIKSCLPEFQKETGIHCELLELSENNLYKSIVDDADQAVGMYDFCMVDSSWMAEFSAKQVLADLSDYGYDLDDDIIPATKTVCYHDGRLYLAPFYGNVTVLLYNRLMVKEAGYEPEGVGSIEDLIRICQFQKKRHNLGFIYRGDTPNNIVVDFLPILLSYGGWVVDEANWPTVATPEFERAMSAYLQLIDTGRAAPKDDLIAAVANKSAAMGIGWPGWYTPIRNSAMDYLALSGRYRRESVAHNANIYGIWALGVPRNSRHKEEAVKLLAYLMDKDVQKESVIKGGVPCRYSCLTDSEVLKKFPQYATVCKALEGGVYRPVMKEWTQFYTILGAYMQRIISVRAPVKETLAQAQAELEAMLLTERGEV